jgi:hypothetical protein
MEWTGPETLADVEARFPTGAAMCAVKRILVCAFLYMCM